MENKEEFKDIPGYEGLYQVSNFGIVKSLPKEWIMPNGGIQEHSGKLLKPGKSSGYLNVSLNKNKKRKTFGIHVLVAITFLNHIPNGNKIVVDHKDNNKLNNRLDNLQLITNRENCSKDIKSKIIGANFHTISKKWQSGIKINNKRKYLGTFNTQEEASNAYQNALKNL